MSLLWAAPSVWGHGGEHPKPSPAQIEGNSAPIPGSEAFAMALSRQGSGFLTQIQYGQLQEALRHFSFARAIQAGLHPEAAPQDAAYNHSRAEEILCNLLESGVEILNYDFTPGGTLPDLNAVVPFDPQAGILLIKAKTGEPVKQFVIQQFRMDRERYDRQYEIPVDQNGITYILQEITQPAPGKSSTHIAFKRPNEPNPFFWNAITLDLPPSGQLELSIIDEDGELVPAMVRLTALPSGKLWTPAEAADLTPMIKDVTGTAIDVMPGFNIYGPDSSFELRMPGSAAGFYWIVPDSFEMELPAGKYEVMVYRGFETNPVREVIEINSNKWTRKTIQLKRWVDMASKGWYSGDDHVHSRMRSSEDADKLMAYTRAMDVRVSNILEMGDPQRTYYNQRGFGEDFRVEKDGYFLIPGQEDPRSILGHNIGLNIKALARDLDRYLFLDWIAENVHEQGGLFGQTHVGQNACEAHRGMALMVPREMYDFYSIMQGGLGTELYYDFLDLGYKLTASAGSDMPYAGSLGDVRLYAFIDPEKPFTSDAWFDAIKDGHTFVTNGPMLEFSINNAMPGDELDINGNPQLTIEAKAWGLKGESQPVRLEIVRLSEVIHAVGVGDADEARLATSFTIPADNSCWIAARVYAQNGSVAHTTPIYIKKPDQRHWNPKRVKDIINRQMAILDEIEGVLAAAEESARKGTLMHVDYWGKRSIEQADPLRERLEITRGLYRELLAELAD
ncbi:MAG: CehA/McbA family metallohydrolase [Puniceicoccaceae bacterium]